MKTIWLKWTAVLNMLSTQILVKQIFRTQKTHHWALLSSCRWLNNKKNNDEVKLVQSAQIQITENSLINDKETNMISQAPRKDWLINIILTIIVITITFSHNAHVCARIHHQKKSEFGYVLTFFFYSASKKTFFFTDSIIYRRKRSLPNKLDF